MLFKKQVYRPNGADVRFVLASMRIDGVALSREEVGSLWRAVDEGAIPDSVPGRMLTVWDIGGRFDARHLIKLHKHLYGEAGGLRTDFLSGRIGVTCMPRLLRPGLKAFAREVHKQDYMRFPCTEDDAAAMLARHFRMLNYLQPFCCGNGHMIRIILRMLARNAGLELDFTDTPGVTWARCVQAAGYGSDRPAKDMLFEGLRPLGNQ